MRAASLCLLIVLAGCGSDDDGAPGGVDAADADADADADVDVDVDVLDAAPADAQGSCFVATVGVTGECLPTSSCAALGKHTSTPGYCPGPADIQCCWRSPNVADNPPVPPGWRLMRQSAVTPEMTTWAVAILRDPISYPMFSTTTRSFGAQLVMARVEWHPPDFQNNSIHRGVTLYVPT